MRVAVIYAYSLPPYLNLKATKLFIVTPANRNRNCKLKTSKALLKSLPHHGTKGGGNHPLRFRVRFKILYRVIQPLIQQCLLHKMVYLNIIYVIATRNYESFTTGNFP